MSPLKPVTVRRWLVIAVIFAAPSLPVAAYFVGSQTSDNCVGIHKLVVTLDTMISNSRSQIEKYEQEGTLSHAQVVRALREQDENRRRLAGADCK